MKYLKLTILFFCCTLWTPIAAQEYTPKFESFILANGLKITLHHDSTVSFVTLNMSYRAGSSRDPKGKSGIANISGETLLTGTRNFPREELIRLRTENDVSIRAQSTVDWFSIASVFPADMLEHALMIEGERLEDPESSLSVEVFNSITSALQREHERRAKKPLATLTQQIYHELYAEDHPYRHSTIGEAGELAKLTIEDVRTFMTRYFSASNACLTIGGKFETSKVKTLISKYFDKIPAGVISRWKSRSDEFKNFGQAAFVREDRLEFNQLHLVFPTVRYGHTDDASLIILAKLMNGSQHGLLREAIVNVNPAVVNAEVYQSSQEIGGNFWISVTVKPEMRLQVLYDQIMNLLASLAKGGVAEKDVLAARNQSAIDFYSPLEAIYGFGGRCDLLNLGMLYGDDPLYCFDLFNQQQSITASELRRIAARYLNHDNVLVVSCVPMGKTDFAVNSQ
jgi:zinc protease